MTPNQQFVKPQYGSRCFADIPATLKTLLTGEGRASLAEETLGHLFRQYETVILFFVDAFGWCFWERYREAHPFLAWLAERGIVSKLTSQFPSTTAAHVTAIHTGLPPAQSGVYEWYYYDPEVDAMIAPLLFSEAGTKWREGLQARRVDPTKLYPTQTLYQELQAYGVNSYVFQPSAFTPSTYSNVVLQGAEVMPYRTLSEALVNLRLLLAQRNAPSYFFVYFDAIDAIGHYYGPGSPQIHAEIETFLATMERLFLPILDGKTADTLFLMTADHGQVAIDPMTTVYLNTHPAFSGVERFMKRNRGGHLLVPGGSCRDMFLYIQDDLLDKAQVFLAERLEGTAEVYRVADLIAAGFFGDAPPSKRFQARVGNLVILPYAGESVWWYEKGKFEQAFYGHHGGLTRDEMEIPLVACGLGG